MSALWRLCVAAAAALAAAWLIYGGGPPPVEFLSPEPAPPATPAPAAVKLTGPAPAPVRYAYEPHCNDGTDGCRHHILVSATGQQWWVEGAHDDAPFALSADGTLVVHPLGDRFVARDLTTGTVTELPIKTEESVGEIFGAQQPLLSLDGRHLLVQHDHLDEDVEVVLERPMIVDIRRGTVRRLPKGERVAGWTTEGLALVTDQPARDLPGYATSATYVIRSPGGRVVRRFTVPGNLAHGLPSPSARTLATLAKEIAPHDVVSTGILLTGTGTGKTLRTIVPRLPEGLRADALIRWEGEDALLVRAEDRHGKISYHVVDLATGAARDLRVAMAPVSDYMLAPAELSVLIGSVR
ncbi:hypothetical protein [Nonomuraea harbinensis]|uniref:Uncharacterized protein n=1 Tax=Nonomuraea harbinensis TaxID=1286938 RepID=A0ABW1BSX9_9ACTN|nr:hypothetical protein [Nonomuraea harbinensis]